MLAKLCLSLTLPMLLGGGADNLPAGWKAFAPKDGGFTVGFPGTPAESKQRVKTATGQLEVTLYLAEAKNGTSYLVSHSDLPADEVKAGTEEKRLDFARDGAVANARGKLRSEKRVEVDGCLGRELVVETKTDAVIRMRVIAARNRLFQVMVMGSGGAVMTGDATSFLDSFRLVK